jgi:transposase-like protein
MFDRSDETFPVRPRRVEVFTEPERRRDWPDERKIAIVAESLAPGVNICKRCSAPTLTDQAAVFA